MRLVIPELLADRARGWGGANGERWLAYLPELVNGLTEQWGLRLGSPLRSHISFIAPALRGRTNDEPVVLKIPMLGVEFPYAQANNRSFEPVALRHWHGAGSIELVDLDAASGAMLLEACNPGTQLTDAGSLDDADDIAAALLRRLWVPPPTAIHLPTTADLAAEWARRATIYYQATAEPFEAVLLDEALALLDTLAVTSSPVTLLHGDFHHGNVLAAQREAWLTIDPLPLIGDREYDAVMFLLFRKGSTADPEVSWDAAIASFCDRLDLDTHRVKQWIFVRLVCDALAFLSHGGSVRDIESRQQDLWSARLVRTLI